MASSSNIKQGSFALIHCFHAFQCERKQPTSPLVNGVFSIGSIQLWSTSKPVFNKSEYDNYDYVIWIDLDSNGWKLDGIIDCFNKKNDWDSVCKSVLEYYDKCYDFEKVGKAKPKPINLTNI